MKITYGIENDQIDVTEICFGNLVNNIITIPSNDVVRSNLFPNTIVDPSKYIFITIDNYSIKYDHSKTVYIDLTKKTIHTTDENETIYNTLNKLSNIHRNLNIQYGSFNDEFPEQLMAARYLTGNEKVLEIGGNIGRNSLVIASILNQNNNTNFVSLESNFQIACQLRDNRDNNNLFFYIENVALSKRKLIQMHWDTFVSEELLDGYTPVKTITWSDLNNMYNIVFDTLVLDCEGAFYYILMDMPEILNNIKLIIMENDYHNIEHKIYIDEILKSNGFYVDYVESGGWGPCYNNFYEVWKRNIL